MLPSRLKIGDAAPLRGQRVKQLAGKDVDGYLPIVAPQVRIIYLRVDIVVYVFDISVSHMVSIL